MEQKQKRSQWASNLGFILAAAGSAVGLGNIWKFPGKVAANGGGAFLICYILIVAFIGFPVMLAELSIGRSTQKNVIGAFRQLNRHWSFAGGIGVLTLFVILSYYTIVGGWVMKYVWVYLSSADFGSAADGASVFTAYFSGFISKPVEPLLWAAAFFSMCIYVVVHGVSGGIERVSKILMPGLFVLLLGIVIYAFTLDGAKEGLGFMLRVDPAHFNGDTVVAALGQAFFSLSVGMGIMVTYGSYVPKTESLAKSAGCICVLDSLVAILSGLAIIPVVYLTAGPEGMGMGGGFAFMALPEIFSRLPGGRFLGFAFFLLLFLAALTSAISILESCIAWLTEEFHLSRLKATLFLAVPMSVLSAGYSLSQGAVDIRLPWFDFTNGLHRIPMNAAMEKFTDNLMIPLGALCFCLFTGWIWGTKNASRELETSGHPFALKKIWAFSVRFMAPAVIVVILYFTLGKGQGLS
ncbi:sodium-dependent transporter [Clostridium sp. chh4-2]|uniref:sodium-dependent transporter n=1 Tax=Clostridium sp. chh4-2 TaxID=2067550 RepID=UPI000CCDBEB2|nr:sodium-dependent transporter [Clostridium sp. chh4-2]PNV59894.1 sodium-dependent transporter [Clostridium sp. chh4-2]